MSPRFAALTKPAGRSTLPISSTLRAATPASFQPGFNPTRGSGVCAFAPAAAIMTPAAALSSFIASALILLFLPGDSRQHSLHACDLGALIRIDVRDQLPQLGLLA